MRVPLVLAAASLAACTLTETPLGIVGLGEGLSRMSNGIKKDNAWQLKNGASGSVVNFVTKNTDVDEWSVELDIQEPELKYPAFAGIYLWYTDAPVTHGSYKGAQGKFSGIVAGLEFLGKTVDIVISVNHGDEDYSALRPEETELKDSPDPFIFRNHKRLTLKVISTSKNFKVEVYGEKKELLYDRVRYTAMSEIGTRLSGKYFSISTEYHHAPSDKSITLTGARFSRREESGEYDPSKYHAHIPDFHPRPAKDVTLAPEEIQHSISSIEHLVKYLRVVLGEPQTKPVAENVVYLKKTLNFQSAHIVELREILQALTEVGKKHAVSEDAFRDRIVRALGGLERTVREMHFRTSSSSGRAYASRPFFAGALLCCLLAFAGGYLVAQKQAITKKLALH